MHQLAIFLFTLSLLATCATALVNDLPIANGPVPPIDPKSIQFGKSRLGQFEHPGIWHSHEDLERIRIGVQDEKEPWHTAYGQFKNDEYSLANYTMQGPKTVLSRGLVSNYSTFTMDVRAAWQNALMWYITKEQAHWDRATTILDAWGSNLTSIIGTDRSLLVALEGQLFVNAAEIMRWEGNWTEVGAKWQGGSGFSNQLYWLFARQSIIVGQANYGMASISALLSFAVYLEDASLYNYALSMYQNDICAGLYGNWDTTTGQSAEAGRDQGNVDYPRCYGHYINRHQGMRKSASVGPPRQLVLCSPKVGTYTAWGTISCSKQPNTTPNSISTIPFHTIQSSRAVKLFW